MHLAFEGLLMVSATSVANSRHWTFPIWHERQIRMTIHCAFDHLIRVGDLKPHPKNSNTHSAAQVAANAHGRNGLGRDAAG